MVQTAFSKRITQMATDLKKIRDSGQSSDQASPIANELDVTLIKKGFFNWHDEYTAYHALAVHNPSSEKYAKHLRIRIPVQVNPSMLAEAYVAGCRSTQDDFQSDPCQPEANGSANKHSPLQRYTQDVICNMMGSGFYTREGEQAFTIAAKRYAKKNNVNIDSNLKHIQAAHYNGMRNRLPHWFNNAVDMTCSPKMARKVTLAVTGLYDTVVSTGRMLTQDGRRYKTERFWPENEIIEDGSNTLVALPGGRPRTSSLPRLAAG